MGQTDRQQFAETFIGDGQAAGSPPDQVARFWVSHYAPTHPQWRFHAAAREADQGEGPTQLGFGGTRGPGKSHAMLAQIGLDDCQRQPGLKALMLRKVGKAVRESVEDLRRRVFTRTPHRYLRGEGLVVFPNESRIILGHFRNPSDIDAYLGLQYDVVGVEEATTLTLEKYLDITTTCRTSKLGWRPRLYVNANPGGVGHSWFKRLFIDQADDPDVRFIFSTVDDNPYIDSGYVKRLDGLTGWKHRAWRLGDWNIAAGQFFDRFDRNIHAVEPFDVSPHWKIWCSMDYGFGHLNVILVFAQNPWGVVYVVGELVQRRALISQHIDGLTDLLGFLQLGRSDLDSFLAPTDVFAKRRGGEPSVASEWESQGWHLTQASMGRLARAAHILQMLGDPERGIEPNLFFFSTCVRTIDCIGEMQHDPKRPDDVLKVNADPEGFGGDDPYDALGYGIMEVAPSGRELEVGPGVE